uniref:Pentatricopeptide repeat-containing protein n=1 Tax=Chenopodium quinoa TaxID=63459 RepID=A0A803NCF6_CHEQI
MRAFSNLASRASPALRNLTQNPPNQLKTFQKQNPSTVTSKSQQFEAQNLGGVLGIRLLRILCVFLIGSWGRLGLAKYCVEIFGQISFLGLSPTTRLYNAVLDALIKSNSLDLAYFKFQQMTADYCKPDRFTYNILIHGVCKAGVVDEALRLVKQMTNLGYAPNVFTYTILIDGYCNANRHLSCLKGGLFQSICCVFPILLLTWAASEMAIMQQ